MATFLLISFGVAVSAFITNLGQAQVEDSAICPVNIDLRQKSSCYDGQQIIFSIQNGINIKVIGLVVSIIGTEEAKTVELDNLQLEIGGVYSGNIVYDQSVSGEIRQLKITPKISLSDQELICLEQGVIIEAVEKC